MCGAVGAMSARVSGSVTLMSPTTHIGTFALPRREPPSDRVVKYVQPLPADTTAGDSTVSEHLR